MENNPVKIDDLINELIHQMEQAGYSKSAIWGKTSPVLNTFLIYARRTNREEYSVELAEEYFNYVDERFNNGEIGLRHHNQLKYEVRRLQSFYDVGRFEMDYQKRGSMYRLNSCYLNLHDSFIQTLNLTEKGKSDMSWAVRRYLHFLQEHGAESLDTSSIDLARDFIVEVSTTMKSGSLKNLLGYLRQFQMYLNEQGVAGPDCFNLFSVKIRRDYPIYDYVTDDELKRIIEVIDRSDVLGKRDYAIVMLGACLGIRAGDIIHLKTSDIVWEQKEIRFVQSKTKKPIVLPLVSEVETALLDYLQNGRPQMPYPELFLRVLAPIGPIQQATAIQHLFRKYSKAAGVANGKGEGKNFHGLRRRLGRNMLIQDVPVNTIAQVLGHHTLGATHQYLSIDSQNLKQCALDFTGISVERSELYD